MTYKMVKILMVLVAVTMISVPGCSGIVNADPGTLDPQSSPSVSSTVTTSATPFSYVTNTPVIIPPTYTDIPTFTPSATSTPSPTDTPMPTDTPSPTPTEVSLYIEPGYVVAPILLYHHIADAGYVTRYYVTPELFRAQLQKLRDWGYTSITVSELVNVLIYGGELPARPVVITFDDGNNDIYDIAFPIMHEMGFVGTFYIVGDRLHSRYYVHAEQLQEMISDGWEIGDHSMTHVDLTLDHSIAWNEILQSRLDLEAAIGVSISTFAYPYGKTDEFITNKVSEYGYRAAMGLGRSWEHSFGTLYYLTRIEVQGDYDLSTFASLLPWSGD